MKSPIKNKKFRYGSSSALITVSVIAVVVLINIIFTSLANKFLWYLDMTPEELYTVSDECFALLDETFKKVNEDRRADGHEDVKVIITFCDEPDNIEENETLRLVYNTALELEKEYPETIEVRWYDIIRNPSAVQQYGRPSTTSVIIESGTEFRVQSIRSFYTFESDSAEVPWAYNAEKKFAACIMAVTQLETPLALFTSNHGEQAYDIEFETVLVDAGYKVSTIDLAKEDIPEDCRLLVTFMPADDFLVKDGVSEISEIEKLDKFLDGTNAYMVFTDYSTPTLPNLEEYLEEWGIAYERADSEYDASGDEKGFNYMIKDTSQSLSADGFTFIGEYVTKGLGGNITQHMRTGGVPKKVIFRDATAIKHSYLYDPTNYHDDSLDINQSEGDFIYYTNDDNGYVRSMYPVFTTSASAEAMVKGKVVDKATSLDKFMLFTITQEDRNIQESNYTSINNSSYVLACSSTQFASEAFLQSAVYGNSDMMMSAFRAVGKEIVPVGLTFKPFASQDIESITTKQANQYTVVLTVIPAVVLLGAGVFVIVKRRFS